MELELFDKKLLDGYKSFNKYNLDNEPTYFLLVGLLKSLGFIKTYDYGMETIEGQRTTVFRNTNLDVWLTSVNTITSVGCVDVFRSIEHKNMPKIELVKLFNYLITTSLEQARDVCHKHYFKG